MALDTKQQVAALFSDRINDLGLSVSEAADKIGVTDSRVRQLLRGDENISLNVLAAVAKSLGCDVEVILTPKKAS